MSWINGFPGGGGADTSDGTAVAADIRSGKIAYVKDVKITGSMQDYAGSYTFSPSATAQTIQVGGRYVPSNFQINAIPATTATAATVRTGYTFLYNGAVANGSIPTYSGSTGFLPTTGQQTINTQNTFVGSNMYINPVYIGVNTMTATTDSFGKILITLNYFLYSIAYSLVTSANSYLVGYSQSNLKSLSNGAVSYTRTSVGNGGSFSSNCSVTKNDEFNYVLQLYNTSNAYIANTSVTIVYTWCAV